MFLASIIIKKDINFNDIEDVLKEINIDDEKLNLRIPSKLRFSGGFGIEIALIQMIITWSRSLNANELHTYLTTDNKIEYLNELNAQLSGLCALAMSPQITDVKHNKVSRKEALENAIPLITAMDNAEYNKTGKGPEVNLVSISGAQKEYIGALYSNKKTGILKSRVILTHEIENILNYISTISRNKNSFKKIQTQTFYERIAIILFELFINIDEHAKRDMLGNKYIRTVSGVKFGSSDYTHEELNNFFINDKNLKVYIEYLNQKYNEADKIRIFEISIFDSGPGYARRWTNKNFDQMDIEDEIIAFRSCLDKHGTTKTNNAAGLGLSNVREILKTLDGYIRIRSGRLCFQEVFTTTNHEYFNEELLAPAEGTAISICIPF